MNAGQTLLDELIRILVQPAEAWTRGRLAWQAEQQVMKIEELTEAERKAFATAVRGLKQLQDDAEWFQSSYPAAADDISDLLVVHMRRLCRSVNSALAASELRW